MRLSMASPAITPTRSQQQYGVCEIRSDAIHNLSKRSLVLDINLKYQRSKRKRQPGQRVAVPCFPKNQPKAKCYLIWILFAFKPTKIHSWQSIFPYPWPEFILYKSKWNIIIGKAAAGTADKRGWLPPVCRPRERTEELDVLWYKPPCTVGYPVLWLSRSIRSYIVNFLPVDTWMCLIQERPVSCIYAKSAAPFLFQPVSQGAGPLLVNGLPLKSKMAFSISMERV